MSFHGWTGSGKNYLAKMIAKAIFKKEMRSQFVHLYVATHHFPHAEQTEKYKVLFAKKNLNKNLKKMAQISRFY